MTVNSKRLFSKGNCSCLVLPLKWEAKQILAAIMFICLLSSRGFFLWEVNFKFPSGFFSFWRAARINFFQKVGVNPSTNTLFEKFRKRTCTNRSAGLGKWIIACFVRRKDIFGTLYFWWKDFVILSDARLLVPSFSRLRRNIAPSKQPSDQNVAEFLPMVHRKPQNFKLQQIFIFAASSNAFFQK